MKRPFASVVIRREDISEATKARFVAKIQRGHGCWEWTASKTKQGYGRFMLKGYGCTTAQRVAYTLWVGEIEPGHSVGHLCRSRSCVNPSHLEAVPHRRTHCPRCGTELSQGRTQRYCAPCKRDNGRAWMRERRAALKKAA